MKKAKKITKKTNKIIKGDNKKNVSIGSNDNEMSKLIILILIVAAVFVVFYIITLFVTKEDKDSNSTEQSYEATIQYEKILAGNILSQKPSEYYVLVYFSDDQYVPLYENYLTYYTMVKEDAVPYYTVDMDDVFNNEFVSEESNLNVSVAKDFKFKQTTLLRIIDGKVISTYETKDDITGKFGRMTK